MKIKIYFKDYMYLAHEKMKRTQNERTLIFGSSHAFNDFDTQINGGGNLAVISQDIYYGYQFYKLSNNPNRKNIVLFFSLFTPGSCLLKTKKMKTQCIMYKLLFGIDYEYPEIVQDCMLQALEPKVAKIIEKDMKNSKKFQKRLEEIDELLHKKYNPKKKIKIIHKRSLRHFKESTRPISEMHWCEQFMMDSQQNGQNLFIIIPPAASTYREVLDSPDKLFSQVTEMAKKYPNVTVLNLFDSPMFQTEHFADSDHLNYKGAKIMTDFLWSEISKKDKV